MYDKPKVTIDLDEYNALLKAKTEAMRLDNLEINTVISFQHENRYNMTTPFNVRQKEINGAYITYTLSDGMKMFVRKLN